MALCANSKISRQLATFNLKSMPVDYPVAASQELNYC